MVRRFGETHGRRLAGLAGVLALSSVALPAAASAATFQVLNTGDAGADTLRAAITNANASTSEPDVVQITATGTVQLASPLPNLEGELDVVGPGADQFTVRRNSGGDYRIFTVPAGADVEISGLTITNGLSNSATGGGGIHNEGMLELRDAAVVANSAVGVSPFGGGISNAAGASLSLDRVTVSDNAATGAMYSGEGGGIVSFAPVTIERSTVSKNTASGGLGSFGGGISAHTSSATLTIRGSTVAANTATSGANLYANAAQPVGHLQATIVADPMGGVNCFGPGDPFLSDGFNLDEDGSCTLGGTGAVNGVDPVLGPLAANGGPTQTHAISTASPALDAGVAAGLATDQRGEPRPSDFLAAPNPMGGDGSDIGAFEAQAPPPPPPTCRGKEATIVARPAARRVDGTPLDDVIVGTDEADFIDAGSGDDIVCARGGDDDVTLGAGRDRADGEAGDDTERGGGGRDELTGGGGRDKLKGGGARDNLDGGADKDQLDGGPANDRCEGGPARDRERRCE